MLRAVGILRNVLRAVGILLIFGFTLIVCLIIFIWVVFKIYSWDWEKGALPQSVEVTRVLTSGYESDLREGCAIAIYSLSPSMVAGLEQKGIAYLGHDTQSRNGRTKTNPYSDWQKTPVPTDPYLYAWHAAYGCGLGFDKTILPRIQEISQSPGGFYIKTKNNEGLILVLPKQKLAVYIYFG